MIANLVMGFALSELLMWLSPIDDETASRRDGKASGKRRAPFKLYWNRRVIGTVERLHRKHAGGRITRWRPQAEHGRSISSAACRGGLDLVGPIAEGR